MRKAFKIQLSNDRQIEGFLSLHGGVVTISVLAIFMNVFSVHTYLARLLSYRRQGSRLRDLTGTKGNATRRLWQTTIIISSLSAVYGVLLYMAHYFYGVAVSPLYLPSTAIYLMILNLALATAIVTHWVWVAFNRNKSNRKGYGFGIGIDDLPPNSILLGSSSLDENSDEETPIVVDRKALNGNILVTGSIGSGKSQGTILPYLDQILSTFKHTPAVVAIDPKGSFIKEAFEIAKKHDHKSRILHLRLGGDVSFNPIYVDDALKNGRFLDVAQMIRAAALNFSGRGSGDSPFWEMSAFNLTKNALVYIAAVQGYYTLSDLYLAMTDAVEDTIAERLEEALRENKEFDDEQKANIRYAISYFSQEFRNFDPKVKTGILATATSFLNQFQEYRAKEIFCPPEDKRSILSMDQVVDEGLFLFFDVESPGLAKALGTFIKLHYQQSILRRLSDEGRGKDRPALLIIDEYQDVASSGYGSLLGDDRFLAKGREANAITIVATQSLSSLENSLGKKEAAKELCQNFRTRIALHSSDLLTISTFKELVGDEEREKQTHSFSEMSQDTRKNYVTGSFESDNANISESFSTALHREPILTGKEFSNLGTFESFALVYDGFKTKFIRLNLKPYFLGNEYKTHANLKKMLAATVALLFLIFDGKLAAAFPNICDVVKQPAFSSCLQYKMGSCMCPGTPPRPCASFTYYVPETYVEVTGEPGSTKFHGLPGVEYQLSNLGGLKLPYGTEGGDFEAFQARTIPVPFGPTIFDAMPCSNGLRETSCFGAMSEHLGSNWSTGAPDLYQPSHLLWASNPKACLLVGAARSLSGGGEASFGGGSAMCSVPLDGLSQYPPSAHSACNGWGVFYPRVGMYDGPSQTTAALMVASRMKSLSTEVFHSAPSSSDEKWQMIMPSGSQCFREGQNVGFLETASLVNDRGRVQGRLKDYLFVVWKRVSCCKDYSDVPTAAAVLAGMTAACQGLGGTN